MPRTTLVTGASRRRGIGAAVVRRLLQEDGARVFAQGYAPYDATEPWGADADDPLADSAADRLGRAATKGALHQITASLADALAGRGVTVNTVNPGPTDTGWATPAQDAAIAAQMPHGRWNRPEEAADVVALLLDPAAASITGQVVDAEGGFRRWTP